MTNKTIMMGLVALAFVAGSITTGSMAYAAAGGTGDNLIVDALNRIATAISGINPNVTVEPTAVNVNVDPTPITINAPAGPQGIQGEKGDKGDIGPQGPAGDDGVSGTMIQVTNLLDGVCDVHGFGWCPDGLLTQFVIPDTRISKSSLIMYSMTDTFRFDDQLQCDVTHQYDAGSFSYLPTGAFVLECSYPISDNARLNYSVINP